MVSRPLTVNQVDMLADSKRFTDSFSCWMEYYCLVIFLLFQSAPGCKDTSNGQRNICFSVIVNDSLTRTNELSDYCLKNGGNLFHAADRSATQLLEQFIYFMQLNLKSNFSRCLVIGSANTSFYSTLPFIAGLSTGNATFTCAVLESSNWNIQLCNGSNCGHFCIARRGSFDLLTCFPVYFFY